MVPERNRLNVHRFPRGTGGLNTGAMGIGTSAVPKENRTPTLADAGIDRKLSSRAQKLAAVPEEKFEAMLGEWREGGGSKGSKREPLHRTGS